jgi:serine/threonine-protein kinase
MAWLMLGATLRNSGQMAKGRVALLRSIEINPHASWTRHVLGVLELLEGHPEAALASFQQAGAPYRQCGIAMAEHTLGHAHESAQALAEAEAEYAVGFSIQIAEAHAWRGDRDAAFEWLQRAATFRDSGIARMRSDPIMLTLHDDPRWAALLKQLNFPA